MSEQKTHWGVRLITTNYTTLAAEADPDTDYACDSVDHDVTVVGAVLDEGNPDLVAPFEPIKGEWVYVVGARRSSGDSFHTDTGIFEAVALYRDLGRAELAAAAIEEHNHLDDSALINSSRLAILDDRGEPVRVWVSWRGYFDHLESVRVERVRVS